MLARNTLYMFHMSKYKSEFLKAVTCLGQHQTFYDRYLLVLKKMVDKGKNKFQNQRAAEGI